MTSPRENKSVCDRVGAKPSTPKPESKLGIALSTIGKLPINGNKNAIDKLEAAVAETRNLHKIYFDELKQLLIRKKKIVHALSIQESAALLEVFKSGPGVFESKDKFLRWLNYPNTSFGGKTPLKLMLSNKAKLVRDELLRIENGIFS